MAFPIPREAPVMSATLPFIEFVIVLPIPFNLYGVEIGAILSALDDMKINARVGDKIPENGTNPKEKKILGGGNTYYAAATKAGWDRSKLLPKEIKV